MCAQSGVSLQSLRCPVSYVMGLLSVSCLLIFWGFGVLAVQECGEGEWSCKDSCISIFSPCSGLCFSPYPGGERYAWCEESQQCIMQGVRCSIMWGVGCGKSSYFCWQGNVCLPRSVTCNGYCTKHYKRRDQMSCVFDPDEVISEKEDNKVKETGGTHAPVETIMFCSFFGTLIGVLFNFRNHIMDQVMAIKKRKRKRGSSACLSWR